MKGLRLFTRASDGGIILASCHPLSSETWHWSVGVTRRQTVDWGYRVMLRASRRTHQWHDFYRLPFGWSLVISRQDYHRRAA
jgi:hypothetical protein